MRHFLRDLKLLLGLTSPAPRSAGFAQLAMSTTPFPLDAAAASLRGEEGLYVLDEPRIGDRILELERRGFPYFTHFGLEFCQQFALDEVSGQVFDLAMF